MDMANMQSQQPAEGAQDPAALLKQAQELIGQALAAMGGAEPDMAQQRAEIAKSVFSGQ